MKMLKKLKETIERLDNERILTKNFLSEPNEKIQEVFHKTICPNGVIILTITPLFVLETQQEIVKQINGLYLEYTYQWNAFNPILISNKSFSEDLISFLDQYSITYLTYDENIHHSKDSNVFYDLISKISKSIDDEQIKRIINEHEYENENIDNLNKERVLFGSLLVSLQNLSLVKYTMMDKMDIGDNLGFQVKNQTSLSQHYLLKKITLNEISNIFIFPDLNYFNTLVRQHLDIFHNLNLIKNEYTDLVKFLSKLNVFLIAIFLNVLGKREEIKTTKNYQEILQEIKQEHHEILASFFHSEDFNIQQVILNFIESLNMKSKHIINLLRDGLISRNKQLVLNCINVVKRMGLKELSTDLEELTLDRNQLVSEKASETLLHFATVKGKHVSPDEDLEITINNIDSENLNEATKSYVYNGPKGTRISLDCLDVEDMCMTVTTHPNMTRDSAFGKRRGILKHIFDVLLGKINPKEQEGYVGMGEYGIMNFETGEFEKGTLSPQNSETNEEE